MVMDQKTEPEIYVYAFFLCCNKSLAKKVFEKGM